MADIQPGFTYSDVAGAPNNNLNAQNLHELVGNAIILPEFVSTKTLKSPAALSDKLVIEDGGVLKYTTLQQLHDLILYPGSIVQVVSAAPYTANTALGALIPLDDTAPQIGEGTEILALSITPRFSTSLIRLVFDGFGSKVNDAYIIWALFRSPLTSCLKASAAYVTPATTGVHMGLDYVDSPATASPVTYTIRAGGSDGAMRMNGTSAARLFGGTAAATLVAQEIKV